METLLLTWTIQPNPNILFLNIKDPLVRYSQYVQNIIKYICFSDADAIVFCENSWFEIKDYDTLMGIAKIFGKKLEILQFDGDHKKAVEKWRWFGESEIIEYAIQNSRLIEESWQFIKITWRYRCKNINAIIHWSKDKEACFCKLMPASLLRLNTKGINTALFKTTVWFFNKVLTGAGEEVNDSKIIFLEHIYYKRLKKIAKKIRPLPQYPKMRGFTWAWGVLKKWVLTEAIMQILHRLWINNI